MWWFIHHGISRWWNHWIMRSMDIKWWFIDQWIRRSSWDQWIVRSLCIDCMIHWFHVTSTIDPMIYWSHDSFQIYISQKMPIYQVNLECRLATMDSWVIFFSLAFQYLLLTRLLWYFVIISFCVINSAQHPNHLCMRLLINCFCNIWIWIQLVLMKRKPDSNHLILDINHHKSLFCCFAYFQRFPNTNKINSN